MASSAASGPTGNLGPTAQAAAVRTATLYVANNQQEKPGPDTQSADHKAMRPLWDKVAAVSGGVDVMRAAGEKYLPKLEAEEDKDYKTRVSTTPFTNIYDDIVGSLATKPFSREVQFEQDENRPVASEFEDLYEDIDGRGNNLHVFAGHVFKDGLNNAIDWILIDYTKLPPLSPGVVRSRAQEKQLGARPYWTRVSAVAVTGVYSVMVAGKEVLTHIRFYEPVLERNGYEESFKERYRIYERPEIDLPDGKKDYGPAVWRIEEAKKDDKGKVTWEEVDSGIVDIGVIPMVPFCVGKRKGKGGWEVEPPLAKLLDMQLDAFLQESNTRNIEMLVCYPMLTASGVAQPTDPNPVPGKPPQPLKVKVGPRAVLWAPPNPGGGQPGKWEFIEPSAESVKMLKAGLETTWKNMRDIGMQPMSESNITVITSANVSVKAKSALQAWALLLKDSLEQAFVITALWLGKNREDAPGVDVYKDFGVDLQSGKEMDNLLKGNEQGIVSDETVRFEMRRRNILSDSFEEDDEVARLAMEAANAVPDGGEDGDIAPDPGPAGEPADPAQFGSADDIDDETLASLGL